MTVADGVFMVSAAVALLGALLAVGLKNIFHNILGFALAMLGVAGVFASMGSDFLAAVFVLVYVGAVAIAMVYAVMLSHPLDLPSLAGPLRWPRGSPCRCGTSCSWRRGPPPSPVVTPARRSPAGGSSPITCWPSS